jgi:hypothetical protein
MTKNAQIKAARCELKKSYLAGMKSSCGVVLFVAGSVLLSALDSAGLVAEVLGVKSTLGVAFGGVAPPKSKFNEPDAGAGAATPDSSAFALARDCSVGTMLGTAMMSATMTSWITTKGIAPM